MAIVRVSGSPSAFQLGGVVFSLLGALLLALAWHLTQQRQFWGGASTAQGVVESLRRATHLGNGSRPTASIAPLMRFRDAQGRSYLPPARRLPSRPATGWASA